MLSKLTEATLVPLSFALATIGGGTAYITRLHVQTATNTESLQRIETKQAAQAEMLSAMREDLAAIKRQLEVQLNHGGSYGKSNGSR